MRIIEQESIDDITVWFERNEKRLIDIIIEKNLDLQSKIGKEIKKVVNELMSQLEIEKKYKLYNPNERIITNEKSREFISFNDPDFQTYLDQMKFEGKQFGGLLYLVEVMGSYYCGLTERTLDVRFEEHITNALRGYVMTAGNTKKPRYHKFYNAICTVLKLCYVDIIKLYKKLEIYSIFGQKSKREAKLDEIYSKIEPFIKKRVIEIHYGNRLLDVRESEFIEKFPYNALIEEGFIETSLYAKNGPDFLSLRINGLNTAPGGAGVSISLPLYDMAIMIAFGFSGKKIAKTLQNEYNIFTSYDQKKFIKNLFENNKKGATKR